MKTRIKELRREKNYTQEALAAKVGVNQTALSRIECGLTIPDADLSCDCPIPFRSLPIICSAAVTNAFTEQLPTTSSDISSVIKHIFPYSKD